MCKKDGELKTGLDESKSCDKCSHYGNDCYAWRGTDDCYMFPVEMANTCKNYEECKDD